MGLDTIELVIEIEEQFGIDIPDEVAGEIQTMADMQDYLINQLQTRKVLHCPNQHAFHQLRSALMKTGNFARNTIQPDSKIKRFLPKKNRYLFWEKLETCIGCKLPKLDLNSKISLGSLVIPLALTVITFRNTYIDIGFFPACKNSLVALILGLILSATVLHFLSKIPILSTSVPSKVGKIKDLSTYIAGNLYLKEKSPEDDIWNRLCNIVAEHAGVEVKELKPETNFIKDLFPYG